MCDCLLMPHPAFWKKVPKCVVLWWHLWYLSFQEECIVTPSSEFSLALMYTFESLDAFWNNELLEYYTILIQRVKGIKAIGLETILDSSLNWFLVGRMRSFICIANNSRLMYSSIYGLGILILFTMFNKSKMSPRFTTRTSPLKFPSRSSNYEWSFLLATIRFSYYSFFSIPEVWQSLLH